MMISMNQIEMSGIPYISFYPYVAKSFIIESIEMVN